ncbi:PREDICTED: RAD51-associated protein 1 isoform X2 [Mandrillus leucophaeus]|uniref:RAD51 associated protein 1 n=1 Tax=Mandrillus leucophaeus TaxID=9568 RepID=A0A2K5XS51_MANLE|nr:PREDICTED: RAD51-associated protein 1 isoform X1 [Mandrillus leucophaeus]XP_011851676.1 PREDICTED: RAD51-associated protein 1 isoform X2 [Mandrillus leucophaeus]
MVRPVRHKKPVNYSQFDHSDSDDDFVSATVPLNKKSRTTPKELKQDQPKPNLSNLQKEEIPVQEKTPKKRLPEGTFSIPASAVPCTKMALDDKLYQRDLEVALALSVKELPTVTTNVQKSQDKSIEKHGSSKIETMNKSPHISNCSVASDYLDLDKITVEDDGGGVQRKRKAASKAAVQQRKILLEGSDGDSANDTEPDFAPGEDSEDDSDFCESEDNDEDFSMRKSKVKEIKKKEVKVKSPVEKKEKKSKSKCNALVTSMDSAPAAVKSESQSSPKKVSLSSDATRKPLPIHSPSAESRRPKWVPPAASGGSRNSSSPLAVVSVKSPNQSLRLGLSRLARIKPLHPTATSS